MRTLLAVAAALAAGLTASVAAAENRPAMSLRAQDTSYTPAKPTDAPAQARRSPISQREDGSESTVRAAPAKAVSPARTASVKQAPPASGRKAPRKKGRERVLIDPVVTASVAPEAVPSQTVAKGPYGEIISRYASAYGVPVSLAHAVITVESNYRPNLTGSAGEIGLMQIKPATARMMGYSGGASGLFHPETNIKYGMKYLGLAHQLGGETTCGTILKYNAGHAARRMNPVSSAYCRKVKTQLVE